MAATGEYTAQEIASYFENADYSADQVKRLLKKNYPDEFKLLKKEKSRGGVQLKTILTKIFPTVSIKEEFHVGEKLRLDFYLGEPYNIGFEYDGVQHKKKTDHLHQSDEDFVNSQERDKLKEELCEGRGITLVRVAHDEKLTEDLVRNKINSVGYGTGVIKEGFETGKELFKRKRKEQQEVVKERQKKRYQQYKKSESYKQNKQRAREARKQQYQKAKAWRKQTIKK